MMRFVVLSLNLAGVAASLVGCAQAMEDDVGAQEGDVTANPTSPGKADDASAATCGACLEHGGGAGCAPRCPAGDCRACVEHGGGLACLERCEAGEPPQDSPEYDPVLGKKLADAAYHGAAGYSMSACYQYVWSALRSVLGWQIESLPVPAASAYQFGEWVIANPEWAEDELRLVRIDTAAASAPEGSVIVWPRGVCGYNPIHGHIEIALGDGTACSDFCGAIKGCAAEVFMPVK